MIHSLFRILDVPDRRRLRTFLTAVVVYGILQGLGILLVVPTLRALLDGDIGRATTWLGALAAVTALTCAVFWVQGMLGLTIALALLRGLHHRVGDHLGTLPIGWFSADRTGRLTHSLSQGTSMLTAVPAYLLQPLVTAVVTPVTTALGMWLFDWRLALVILLMGPVLLLVYRWAAALAERSSHQVDAASVESASRVVEFARTQPVLRAFGRTADGHHLLDDASVGQRDIGRSAFKTGVPGLAAFATAVQTAFVLIMVLGVWLALDGSIDAPELVVLLVLATRFTGPLVEAADLGASLRLAKHDLERIEEVLVVPSQAEGTTRLMDAPAEVSFENVSFAYGDRDVLHDVTFTVPPGTMTALVGPSGAGKSTVAHLVMRFMDVGDGVCRVGGVDVRDVPLTDLMSMVSMVFQDVYLFDDTIEANIRIGRPDATDEELNRVVRLARVEEIAARLPDGLATRVGEGGASLSGGERQRVSIARALLKDAPIVLLDEATASLDPENEAAIGSALEALTVDRTLIVIAHRLSTIEHADQIVVLDHGRVVQRGTHTELRGVPGRYADFWAERERAQGWRLDAADSLSLS